ncbi:hypothetical protein QJQ45_025946 [Haematococcus lacustris]|nr:hypothetical protein QJQ45_025946 [Haematococcus lacustris]
MTEGSASAGPGTPSDKDDPHIPAAIKAELQTLLDEYSDVFKPLTDTPPERPVGHTIPLVPDARPPVTPMYRLSKPEQEELKRQIQDYLSKGMIEPSSSPYAAPILFVQKKSGELRMCIDYRQLNKLTLRDQYPLPRIDDLFDRLSGCSVFSSLDLQAGYHQIRITPEDVPKTAFRTPEGHFQFKVLSFGLTNAPATFQRVMNDAFAPVLGKCALVYLDDILVMSKSLPEHLQHLRLVFDLLRKNKLYAKMSKCEFMQLTLRFLGHVISAGAISVDPDKVRAIVDWPVPSSLTQLQSFLGAANFVRKFVHNFSAISAPLTDLCGKLSATFPWHSWPDHERHAFYELKAAVANVPMLRLPDHTQPFQVYCDASLQGVGAVLMQDGYPLAYLSKKLSSAEVNYTTGYRLDPAFNAEADLSSMYQDTHGLWRLTGKDKVVVPNDSELRNHILHEMHDAVYSGHVGISKTLERVSRVFWWNTMRADVRYYVSTCDACQRDKASTLKPGGLLNPLSIPDYRWESVSMDFITKLPSGSHGYDAICVFVDRLSKMVHFVPCREDLKARRFAQLFIDHVYKLHGMPAELISDRGSLFTSVFWREVMRRCGSKPALSSSYHPQSDGQTERYNRVLEEMLRHYISPTQSDWPDYLALAEFAVNNSWQESIQSTPFLVNTGQSPVTVGLRDLPYGGRCPSAHAFTRWWQDAVANARKCMAAAQSRQAAYANKARRDVEYKVGQKVLLSTKNLKLQPGKARKLIPRYVGPFEILLLVGAVAVKLDLPASMSRLHPVFHVSLIKPYTGTDVGFMPPPVTWMDETPVYYVERLLDHKGVKDNKASFYLVQWEGYDSTHNTWEPRSNLTDCDKVLAEYNAIHHLKLRPARRGPTVAPTPEAVAAREAADAARLVSPRDAAIARLPANIDPASPAAIELINLLEEQAWPEAHTEYPVYLHGRSVTEHEAMLEASLQRMVARNAAADAPLVEEGQLEDDDEEEELDERDTAIQELHASLQAREDVLVAVQARLTALEASQAAVNAGVSPAVGLSSAAPVRSPPPHGLAAGQHRNTVANLFSAGRFSSGQPAGAVAPQSAAPQENDPSAADVVTDICAAADDGICTDVDYYIRAMAVQMLFVASAQMSTFTFAAWLCRFMTEGSASAGPGTPSDKDDPHIPAAIKAELQTLLDEYSDVFKPLTDTPPERPVGHTIPLVPDARPPVTPMYRLSKPEQEELKRQIQDYLSKGMIEPSSSPYAAPILFVQKKSGELRMCIDYRQLNKLTLRDQYPLPRIDDLFDRLSGCSVFSSLDLRAGYHQIRITPEDVPKTAFRTPEGHFQFKVLSFGLTNAPATFQRVMNDAFAPVLGKCALVYLDDILVMSKSLPEHLQHLRLVFDLLRKNKLYAKMSKCEFMQLTLRFLGHVISAGAISVDPDKVRAIVDWPVPSSLTQLQSFLGAANFVRKFVHNFSAISAPLTDLCGKLSATFPWHSWPDHERLAFYELKAAVANVPMLRLPDHTQPFQVYCDASLQGVALRLSTQHCGLVQELVQGLVQERCGRRLQLGPCAPSAVGRARCTSLSKKLSSAEVNYTTGEQEMLALVTACKEWRCYLEGVPFTLFTDHKPLISLPTQKNLSRRQARWMELLSRFDFKLEYIPGPVNPADPLSRLITGPQEGATVCAMLTRRQAKLSCGGEGASGARALEANAPAAVTAKSSLTPEITENTADTSHNRDLVPLVTCTSDTSVHYPAAPAHPLGLSDQLIQGYRLDPAFNAEADLSSMYQDTHGLWRLTGKDKVVVPNDSELRNHILHEMHDAVYSGHVGISKTLERVSRVFWWNTMRADVRYYVSTCDACQRDKASTLKPGGLLNPLSIPDYRWESVSMDFITKLPSGSHGYDAICVFVDRLSKMVHFVPCREDLKARRFAQLFIDHVYKLHGMPAELISDRGSLFTSVFWREVMRRCGSKPALSSSYHPQSDGQTERYNRVLEEMLRHYISPTQSDWPDYLALAEFAVNNSWQESIQSTPFLVNTGQSPVTVGLRDLPYGGRCPSAHAFTRWWQDAVANARKCMAAAQSRQAAYANKARRDVEYKVGQKVLLSTKNLKLQPGKARKLIPRYVGPFEILLLVGAVAVKLDLPASMSRLHPVFHVSLIKPYTGTDVGFMPPPVTWMDETPVYYVERLLDHKGVKDNKASFYLVQWEGYDSTHNTWEPRSNLTDCDKVLAEYNAIHHLK